MTSLEKNVQSFEEIKHIEDHVEFWLARDLQQVLDL